MLTKQTFASGLAIINASLGKSNKVDNQADWSILYLQLRDLPDESFVKGIEKLMNSENVYSFPGIYKIRKYVESVSTLGYSKSELLDLASVRKSSGIPYSNKELDNIVLSIDLDQSTENSLVFIENKKEGFYIEWYLK